MAENKDNKNTASNTMHLRIVSAEKYIFSDYVRSVSVQGVLGGLGVYPGHSPLLTFINSSNVVYVDKDGNYIPPSKAIPNYIDDYYDYKTGITYRWDGKQYVNKLF